MTSINRSFLNPQPLFNSNKFELWQDRFRIFIQSIINYELWEIIINGLFIPTYLVIKKVVDKPDSFWPNKKRENLK